MPLDVARAKRLIRRAGGVVVGSATGVRTTSTDVVLTYDDGPEPGGTDLILAALDQARVRATFFVLLTRARLYPSLLDEVVSAGHDVALHGIDHRPLTRLSPRAVRREVAGGRAELEDLIGRRVMWVRPPYGRQTPATWAAIRSVGLLPVLWNATTADSQPLDPDSRLASVLAGAAPGTILLCHDGFADARDGVDDGPAPQLDRGALTAQVVGAYQQLGLRPCSLSEALTRGSAVREALFRR